MSNKKGPASGSDSDYEQNYQRKEENGSPKSFGRSKYANGAGREGNDKVKPAFKKEGDFQKPAADEDNPWARPSKARKAAKKEDKPVVDSDPDNPWKRASKGGRPKKSFDDKPYEGKPERKPFVKRDGDAPYADRKPKTDGDTAWKRTEKGDRKKPFAKEDYNGKEAENKWERSNEDGKKPFPKRDRPFPKKDGDAPYEGKKPFPRKDGDAPYGAKKPFAKREGDAPYGAKKPFAKKDGDAPYGAKKPFAKRDGDAPYGAKKPFAKKEGDAPYGAKKPYPKKDGDVAADSDKKVYPKKVKDPEAVSLWQKGVDYCDRGMPKAAGGKRAIKESDKPFFQRNAAKGEQPDAEMPEDEVYESFEISDELLEEKKKNRKVVAKKEDPTRAFKKDTGAPISARHGDKPAKKDVGDRKPKNKIEKSDEKRPFKKAEGEGKKPFDRKDRHPEYDEEDEEPVRKKKRRHNHDDDEEEEEVKGPEAMPLNKYLAHSGVCSRRDAAQFVKDGKVKINGEVITNPGHKVADDDVVFYNDKKLTIQKGMVYILLNKPKDYITTNEDPQGRKTVMQLIATADGERLFPVGRLDRNTSGLLLITNDGDLTQKLAHPSNKVKKIYQVTLDKPVTKADFEKIVNGLTLEDGVAHVDALAYLDTKSEIGIEIHIGRNRIVRRIFESLGYVVEKLDRVMYANLTKKNLPRGKWRYLNEREVVLLKHFKS